MMLPLKIQNTQILASSFSVSRVLYGSDRNDEFTMNYELRKKSLLLDINENKNENKNENIIKNDNINKKSITKTDSTKKNENNSMNNRKNSKTENNEDDDNENEENLGSNPAKNSAE